MDRVVSKIVRGSWRQRPGGPHGIVQGIEGVELDGEAREAPGEIGLALQVTGAVQEGVLAMHEREPGMSARLMATGNVRCRRPTFNGAGFSEREIRELAFVAAFTAFANRALTLPAIPPQTIDQAQDRRLYQWFRPLIAFWFRRDATVSEPYDVEP